MQYDQWRPVYAALLSDFGFDPGADEHARDVLGHLAEAFDHDRLPDLEGATVAVVGGGPSLSDELSVAEAADVTIAASNAADVLREADLAVDAMVTDLDKSPETARELTEEGVPVAVHAHGDNLPFLNAHVPEMAKRWVLPTTQAEPRGPVENFGGFTDGDRGAFLADHFGAGELVFPGWDFDDPSVDTMKAKKLEWAERLLYWLETRRGDSFGVLDGRRDAIETDALPV